MAGWWRGWTLLLLLLCSVSLSAASNAESALEDFSSRKLLQAGTPPPAPAPAPAPVLQPPTPAPIAPTLVPPAKAPTLHPPPAPTKGTQGRTYLMWIGIGAVCLVVLCLAIFCLCRKFEQHKIRGAQRLPPLPRYH